MSEEELEKYLKLVNHFISDDGNLEEIKKYIANVLYDVDKNYKQEIKQLKDQLQQKENIIKEVREYIMSNLITEWDIENDGHVSGSDLPADAITPILGILDKEVN